MVNILWSRTDFLIIYSPGCNSKHTVHFDGHIDSYGGKIDVDKVSIIVFSVSDLDPDWYLGSIRSVYPDTNQGGQK